MRNGIKIVTLQSQNSENPMHSMKCHSDENGELQKDVIKKLFNHQQQNVFRSSKKTRDFHSVW